MNCFLERKYVYSFFLFLILVVGGLTLFTQHTVSLRHCKQTPTVILGGKVFTVTVADTLESRMRGLSGTTQLPPDSGMLFVFASSSSQEFWMKDMAYPLDIIWINQDWLVTGFESSVSPKSFPALFTSPSDTMYALEVNAGVIASLDIKNGSLVQNESKCLNPDL